MEFISEHKKAIFLGIALLIIIIFGTVTYKVPDNLQGKKKSKENDSLLTNEVSNEIIAIDNSNLSPQKTDFEVSDIAKDILGDTNKYSHLGKAFFEIVEDYGDDYDNTIKRFYTQATIKEGSSMLYLQESNYSQFDIPQTDSIVQAYDQPITINVALLNSKYLPEDNQATLDEKVKYLNKNINTLIEDYSEELPGLSKNSKFNYKITGMTIKTESEVKPRNIRVSINNQKSISFELDNTDRYQLLILDSTQNNISKPMNVKITVVDTYNDSEDEEAELKISEIRFGIESNIPQSGQ